MIIISVVFIRYERRNRVDLIIMASKHRKKWVAKKMLANSCILILFAVASYSIYYIRLFEIYQIPSFKVSIQSIPMFSEYAINVSVEVYLVIQVIKTAFFMCLSSVILSGTVLLRYLIKNKKP